MHDLVIRIRCTWQDDLLDVRHLRPGDDGDLATGTGWWWSLGGVGIGWVPRRFAPLLALSPPLLSEVEPRARGLFLVDDDVLPEGVVPVWSFVHGLPTVRVPLRWSPQATQAGHAVDVDALLRDGRARRDDDAWVFLLTGDLSVAFTLGGQTFDAKAVSAAEALPPRPPDPGTRAITGVTAALTALAALVLMSVDPQPVMALSEDVISDLVQRVTVSLPAPPPPPPAPANPGGAAPDRDVGHGKAGAPEAAEAVAAGGSSRRQRDTTIAQQAGVLGAFDRLGLDDGPLGGSIAQGLVDGLGGLVGKSGTQLGSFGLGDRGDHLGGGGDAEGIGGIGTGPGTGDDYGEGSDLGTKEHREPKASAGDPITMGGLGADQIDRVVKARLGAIRYCYQRELQHDPSLSGKVVIKFTIARDGSVSAAVPVDNTVGAAKVGACVAERFYGMTFPEPSGGGIVIVRYPFVFSQG